MGGDGGVRELAVVAGAGAAPPGGAGVLVPAAARGGARPGEGQTPEERAADAERLGEKLQAIQEAVRDNVGQSDRSCQAGQGSGAFHTYRMQRRREQLRVDELERQGREAAERSAFEQRRAAAAEREEALTAKRRKKRQKQKQKARGGAKCARIGSEGGGGAGGEGSAPAQPELD